VTFSSPVLARDVTVYAVAGDRGTILSVAKEHKIPIPFDCQDGECGSCLVEVQHMSDRKCGISLTEKEKEMLRQLGKITREEIVDAEVNDMPPRFRLACQCFVRDEDITVNFAGDETLPAQKPHLTPAAKIFKGGLKPASVEEFLGYAVKVEEDAALHFEAMAASMEECGNAEVAKLFAQLGRFSRLHLAEAQRRAGPSDAAQHVPPDYVWPDHATPERTSLWAGDPALTRLDALRAALVGETRGYEFYYAVAGTTNDAEIAALANQFVREEAEHVEVLKAWITREEWALKTARHGELV
jgi:rubrerythrin/ferredoxin